MNIAFRYSTLLCSLLIGCTSVGCGTDESTSAPATSTGATTGGTRTASDGGSSTDEAGNAETSSGISEASSESSSASSGPGQPAGPGETIWTSERDSRSDARRIVVTEAGDVLVAAIRDSLEVTITRLDGSNGDEVEQWVLPEPEIPNALASAEADAVEIAAIGDDPIVSVVYVFYDENGDFSSFTDITTRLGATEWVFERVDQSTRNLAAGDTGVIVEGSQDLVMLDPQGRERWSGPANSSGDAVVLLDDGGVADIGRTTVARYGPNGELLWLYERPASNMIDRFFGIEPSVRGGFLLTRSDVVGPRARDEEARLIELDANGIEIGDRVTTSFPFFFFAADTLGHVFLVADNGLPSEEIVKYTTALDEIWRWTFESRTADLDDLDADSDGALFVLGSDDTVSKIAP